MGSEWVATRVGAIPDLPDGGIWSIFNDPIEGQLVLDLQTDPTRWYIGYLEGLDRSDRSIVGYFKVLNRHAPSGSGINQSFGPTRSSNVKQRI